MSTKKRQIAFYADDDISQWYESLPVGSGGKLINEYLRGAIAKQKERDAQLAKIESGQSPDMVTRVESLEQKFEHLLKVMENRGTEYSAKKRKR